ncbi:MAG: molybdopterin cofactor-binding domain-containing protein [Acidobacteriota bacterium]
MAETTSKHTVSFTLNGRPLTAAVEPGMSLMDVLREQAGLISPKNGCAPQGSCGCCTVLVNGRALSSCVVPARRAEGGSVVTLEGLEGRERDIFARAFSVAGGLQCGFCIPGIVVAAKHLIDRNPRPSRQQIAESLNNHICRCTGYVKIIDAIDLAARALQGEPLPAPDYSGKIGSSLPRQDVEAFALGERRYVDDMSVPGMLRGAFLFSPHPRIRIAHIDITAAVHQPGVVRVLTAADVPGQRYQGLIDRDWPLFVAAGETTHCIGDILAAVVADTEKHAREAIPHIRVEFDTLPGVFSPEEALRPDAPRVHPDRDNLLSRSVVVRGDAGAALGTSTLVETRTFRTQPIEHAFLEPESCLAVPHSGPNAWLPASRLTEADPSRVSGPVLKQDVSRDQRDAIPNADPSRVSGPVLKQDVSRDQRDAIPSPESRIPNPVLVHVFSQGQGVFDDRRQIASALGLAEEQVSVELVSNGGAFGGKEDLSIQAQVALMALLTGRPVKATLSRDESIRLHPKRHPITLTYTVGCDAEGRLTAVRARLIGDTGAFASVGGKVLERAAGHACGPYRVPAVDVEALAVYTNNPPCGAMRGFGANQAAFAIEGMLDILAEKAGIDGWEMRWRNAVDVGDTFCTGQIFEHAVGVKDTLLAVKDAYYSSPFAGVACGIKNVGIGNGVPEAGQAVVVVTTDGRVEIHSGFTEMGQGFHTAMIQCLSDVTGLDPRLMRVDVSTRFPTPCGMTTASRATVLGGRAVMAAGTKLKADLDRGCTLAALAGRTYTGEFVVDWTTALEEEIARPRTHLTYGFATQVCILDGQGRLKEFVAAHDVGRVINRHLVEGQIEGAVHMGLGYALTEELRLRDGVPESFKLRSLGILRARDMPPVKVILVESRDPEGPFGAKGVGEIGLVPTAPAVASALYRYDGIRRYALPMKESPTARAILRRPGAAAADRPAKVSGRTEQGAADPASRSNAAESELARSARVLPGSRAPGPRSLQSESPECP